MTTLKRNGKRIEPSESPYSKARSHVSGGVPLWLRNIARSQRKLLTQLCARLPRTSGPEISMCVLCSGGAQMAGRQRKRLRFCVYIPPFQSHDVRSLRPSVRASHSARDNLQGRSCYCIVAVHLWPCREVLLSALRRKAALLLAARSPRYHYLTEAAELGMVTFRQGSTVQPIGLHF